MVRFKSCNFDLANLSWRIGMCAELLWLNMIYVVSVVSKVCDVVYSLCWNWKCRYGCLVATVSLEDQDQILMLWAGHRCSCMARYLACFVTDTGWSMSWFLSHWLSRDAVDVNLEESTIVWTVSLACRLVLSTERRGMCLCQWKELELLLSPLGEKPKPSESLLSVTAFIE